MSTTRCGASRKEIFHPEAPEGRTDFFLKPGIDVSSFRNGSATAPAAEKIQEDVELRSKSIISECSVPPGRLPEGVARSHPKLLRGKTLDPVSIGSYPIHVYRLGLRHVAAARNRFWCVLSSVEKARAMGFRLIAGRDAFISTRAHLRILLGIHLDRNPAELAISVSESGKPFLADHVGLETHFNVSHSGDVGLIAITNSGPIGIDVERIDAGHDLHGVAEFSFTRAERLRFEAMSPVGRPREFFSIWTGKEAVVKAWGDGMRFPLNRLEIPFRSASPACGWPIPTGSSGRPPLYLKDLPAIPGYAAALAVTSPFAPIQWREI